LCLTVTVCCPQRSVVNKPILDRYIYNNAFNCEVPAFAELESIVDQIADWFGMRGDPFREPAEAWRKPMRKGLKNFEAMRRTRVFDGGFRFDTDGKNFRLDLLLVAEMVRNWESLVSPV
jgi:hypothetical protein